MRIDPRSLVTFSLSLATFVACGSASSDNRASAPASKPGTVSDVVAEVDGQTVRRQDLDAAIEKANWDLRQQHYDLTRQILDQMIMDQLIEKEASSRGVTKEALLKAEVDDKVASVTAADVDTFYSQNVGRMGGRTKEQVQPDIE